MDRRDETKEEASCVYVPGKNQHGREERGVQADVPMAPE
jgi:hypothetical protein